MRIELSDKNVIKYSTIFIYPFYYSSNKKEIVTILENSQKWKTEKFNIKEENKRAEYVYFHPYIRDILFSQKEKEAELYKSPVTYLGYSKEKKLLLKVKYPEKNKDNNWDWEEYVSNQERYYPIDSIHLSVFEFGIGILSIQISECIEVNNFIGKKFKEILVFNELARKISASIKPSEQKKQGRLLDSINIEGISNSKEEFKDESFLSIENGSIDVSNVIKSLLTPIPSFQSVLDDRMIVYSYVCFDEKEVDANDIISAHEDFLTFTFVDKQWKGSFANRALINEYLKLHLYDRWLDYGTLYGFSRFSSTCLVNGSKGSLTFSTIYDHFETIYYEIALLTYFQRAALLSFSRKAAECAEKLKQSEKNAYENIKKLKKDFLLFTNKYWFIEITGQEQGIDIHNKWSDVIKNNQLFEEVRQELAELDEFVEIIQANSLNLFMEILTIIATIGLILSLWIGFFSISIPDKIFCFTNLGSISYMISFLICMVSTIYIIKFFSEDNIQKKLVEKTKFFLKDSNNE
ncbi:hypothetical protein HY745_14660 [Candidatus Desantisbacteria bacterium]|nr:hypothetical protein [Candidatus Desantisbacteria bacterium]